ncbi:hypothetical protein FHS43_003231 [Streptosporangium becharense]|uniref:WD40 repeat domain-containing protein n=1 Tax=Streptosporangium becharense TaxID=1816182 RepID=A0A7W9IEA7_9ACTN|nr:PD40 domain-containing protein [Streptosporangium becharense]MBB2911951.1 hypothetical protein [Streptosporangium becharense]MBB5818498.1 hypothetical protein [Streptosporangium becharense]
MKHRALAVGAALAVSAALTAAPALAAAPSGVAGAVGAAVPASRQAAPVAGAVYVGHRAGGVKVLVHRGGWTSHTAGGAGFTGQFAVAPDGLRVAWIDDGGRLHVSAGGTDKVVARNAAAGAPCMTPAWTADGKRLAYPVGGGSGAATTVAVVGADGTGRSVGGRTSGPCHLTWSADGRTLAGYAGDTAGVHLLDTRRRVSVRVPGVKLANHVESLSPDARRVVVNAIGPDAPGGDGSWPMSFTPSVYDTRTGAKIAIPVKGRLLGARYLRDGRLAVRVRGNTGGSAAGTLVILSPSGKELQRLPEPAKVRALGLVGVLE